jgi:outer membrane autotransporter protein
MYNQILDRADLLTAMPYNERLLMKTRNKVAEIGGSDVNPGVFSPIMTQDENGGLWFKEYTTFESVPLSNGGPDVSNIGYGTLIGGDFPMKHYRKGWDGVTTIYVAYNGSHQNYNSVGAYQNGGALGITETLFKGNFFTALTVSAGDSYGQANTMYGVDNFNTLLAGVASKTGYNIKVANDKVVFQPSIFLSYTFANTFDYTTASGVEMTSDALNAIQVAPGLKIIYNAENGWQPYLGFNMVFNIMDSQKYYANNVALPQMSIDPYFEYGLGVQRRWGEKFTGFGKTMLRGGGRNGIALMFGFRLAIGK